MGAQFFAGSAWRRDRDIHTLYTAAFSSDPAGWTAQVAGTAHAPQQYRVGVVKTADWMSQLLHIGIRHALGMIDAFAALVAAFLLFSLLERTDVYRNASIAAKWFGSALLVLLVQFYLIWLLWFQRPETMPSAMVVVLLLWLWTRKGSWLDSTAAGQLLTAGLILLLSLAQGFVRADVAFLLNAGIFLACFTPISKDLALPKTAALLSSFVGAGLAAAVQLYMMKVVYPHASYGDTPLVQLALNITRPYRWAPFILFLVPYAWTLVQVVRRKFMGDATGVAFAVGSVLFGGAWHLVGKMDEVRIFIPFALAIAPLTVQLAMLKLEPLSSAEA